MSLRRPHRWDMRFIGHFMLAMGPVSSIFDFVTFFLLYRVLKANGEVYRLTSPMTANGKTYGAGAFYITANATTLCLNNGRFRVQAAYSTPAGQSGPGMAVTQTTDTGVFWFFSANNVEVVLKVLNACTFNQRYWVYAAGLTDVRVVITVTDTQTGAVKTYINPQGRPFQPILDSSAFNTCP